MRLRSAVPSGLRGVATTLVLLSATSLAQGGHAPIPNTQATALDGHPVTLPRDLPGRATILILGFGRHSADATTAWEKPVRGQLAHLPAIAFYDMAMLAEVPGFVRPFVLRAIRKQVPDVLKPNFLPLTTDEDAWKHAAGYEANLPDAAYVFVVDRKGQVLWQTHAAYSAEGFRALSEAASRVAREP